VGKINQKPIRTG